MSADVQHTRRITHAAGVHGYVEDLALYRRRLPRVGIVEQKGAARAALLTAAVPLLALPSLAMADNSRALTVGTVQQVEDPDTTQSY